MNRPTESSGHTLDQFRSYLYLLARAHLGPDTHQVVDASDLVQQTLMDAHAKRENFQGENDAQRAAWLRQILSNNLVDELRHQHRAKRDVTRQRALEAAIDESFCRVDGWLDARQSSPSKHVERKENLVRLTNALTELPKAQQDAVIYRHLQGLSLAEIAARIDRSETAVAGLVYRGMNKLHELLDEKVE